MALNAIDHSYHQLVTGFFFYSFFSPFYFIFKFLFNGSEDKVTLGIKFDQIKRCLFTIGTLSLDLENPIIKFIYGFATKSICIQESIANNTHI